MIGIVVATLLLGASVVVAGVRMYLGPDDANRAVASDLLFFSVVGLVALLGVWMRGPYVFDVVLGSTVVGFLASVALALAVTRGRR
ncbi:monovalent cation/H+ antiporter complex subunit F [Luteococcus sp. Sow4_B9]|uniref:monovalent cation/H+ antiporter complex subunit F n=1 Tax=Luteococcus sp. Sow4_B9 TaxID=3438792 RepID=UPI003F9CB2AF